MKKLLSISSICLGIISWIFFFFLTILAFSPWSIIEVIDRHILTTHSIEFSKLQSSGNALNRNLIFSNIYILHNDRVLIQAKKLELGLSLKPQNLFNFFKINKIVIKDGYLDNSKIQNSNSSPSSIVNFSDEILLSFEKFIYQRDDSIFEINGNLFGDFSRSISGQLSFLHNNQLSTIAVNSFEGSYRFSLNLHHISGSISFQLLMLRLLRIWHSKSMRLVNCRQINQTLGALLTPAVYFFNPHQLTKIKDLFISSLKKI
jgi:hypothetical protein